MDRMRDLNDIIKRLEESKSHYEAMNILWGNVKRCSKKDGADFALLSKNFENAKIEYQYGSKIIGVHDRVNGKWVSDTIYIDENMTVDDIFSKINETSEKYSQWIEENKKQLAIAEEYFAEVESKVKEIESIFQKVDKRVKENGSPNIGKTSLRYALENYVENYYFR